MPLTRRSLVLGSLSMGMVVMPGERPAWPQNRKPTLTVYKSPS